MRLVPFVLGTSLVFSTATGQASWSLVSSSVACGPMGYDEARDQLVVLNNGSQVFDGASWTTVAGSIPGSGKIAFDRTRGRLVCYDYAMERTWEWDGTVWAIAATTGPVGDGAGIAWHEGRQRVMLFGGYVQVNGRITGVSELWEWDGANWVLVPTNNPPPAVIVVGSAAYFAVYSTLVYDDRRDRLVVYGSRRYRFPAGAGAYGTETWEWSALTDWIQVDPVGPSVGWPVFDAARSATDLVASIGSGTTLSSQVYEWQSGRQWVALGPQGPLGGPCAPTMAFDTHRGRILILLSNGELWAFSATNPATATFHRLGCASALPGPAISLNQPWSRPWLGETYSVDVAPLPANLALLAAGFDDQSFGPIALPADLTAAGMSGCFLNIAPIATQLLVGAAGRATYAMPVPNTALLLGQHLLQQAAVLAPGANAAGVVVSDSIRAVVGQLR